MSPPRKDKTSRKDPQQTSEYSSILGDHLRLVTQTDSDAKEKRSKYILVCRGHTNEQIARLLNISVSSVKTYLRMIFLKIDVDSKIELRLKFHNFNFKHDLAHF
jgi:DNA-binding CsgD family transcriptional regulator